MSHGLRMGRRPVGPADKRIGALCRKFRLAAKIYLYDAAKALGVSRQQLAKFERGANRISAVQLYRLAEMYGVPIWAFFDGLPMSGEVPPSDRTRTSP